MTKPGVITVRLHREHAAAVGALITERVPLFRVELANMAVAAREQTPRSAAALANLAAHLVPFGRALVAAASRRRRSSGFLSRR